MKNLLAIYPETNPYVVIVDGTPYHLTTKQYHALVDQMAQGAGTTLISYEDPIRKEKRDVPINLFRVTELDLAEVVQRNNWEKQGGYVCKDGRCVDSKLDCYKKPSYVTYEEVNKMFSGVKEVKKYDPANFRKNFEEGKERARGRRIANFNALIIKYGEEETSKRDDIDKEAFRLWREWKQSVAV